jgi:hypothetical protein
VWLFREGKIGADVVAAAKMMLKIRSDKENPAAV